MLNRALSLDDWGSGAPKFALIRRLLALRSEMPDAFEADMDSVAAPGGVLAFRRGPLLVAVPILCARCCMDLGVPLPKISGVLQAGGGWRNVLDPALPRMRSLDCAELFSFFPVAVLVS
jgi:maltooligosyltrehalose synthase